MNYVGLLNSTVLVGLHFSTTGNSNRGIKMCLVSVCIVCLLESKSTPTISDN